MPPKAAADGESKQTIVALCNMMLSCNEFKLDTATLAPILGVAHAKNVPRKINSIIGPYGFEYKANKIIAKEDAAAPATPDKATDDSAIVAATPKTPKTPASRKKAVSTPASTPAPKSKPTKKRKLNPADGQGAAKINDVDVIKAEDHPMTHVADDFEQGSGTQAQAAGNDVEKAAPVGTESATTVEED